MSSRRRHASQALVAGALVFFPARLPAEPAADCPPDHVDERVKVAKVYDGDTVRLSDGRHLRLIGLDTPELGRDGKPPQPKAEEAKRALGKLLAANGSRVSLRYGRERRDRYQRTLAHAFVGDGKSVAAALLAQGLATALTVPPNSWNAGCYRHAEARARHARAGVWRLPRYQLIEATELPRAARGFRRVRGTVERIGRSRRSVWINLRGNVALRIDHADAANFPDRDFAALRDERVRARGWVYAHRGELRIHIRHPAALQVEP